MEGLVSSFTWFAPVVVSVLLVNESVGFVDGGVVDIEGLSSEFVS